MTKINPNFPHDITKFIHKPIRDLDRTKGDNFLDRFLRGSQHIFEDVQGLTQELSTLNNPAEIRPDLLKYLKDIVGLTGKLDSITQNLSENDLRKLITLAIPLWKQKGLESGYSNIIRLFTGKATRIFDWFDYRWVIGEKALGSEFLGSDTWLISKINVTEQVPIGNVVALISFKNNVQDSSILKNHAVDHARLELYDKGPFSDSGFATFDGGSTVLGGGTPLPGDIISIPYHNDINFESNFTIEFMVRSKYSQDSKIFSYSNGIKKIEIGYNSASNQVNYTISDGTTTVTGTANDTNLADGIWKHVALVVDWGSGFSKIFLTGVLTSAGENLAGILSLDIPNQDIFIGGSYFDTDLFRGDVSNLRVSMNAQYIVDNPTITVPAANFTPYVPEQLAEYQSDIRIVDNGNLDRTLIKRILNLMRPSSERLNIIYVDFFEDFTFGKGELRTLVPGATVSNSNLVLPSGALEECNYLVASEFQNIVLQIRHKFTTVGTFEIRFLVQDLNNYYKIDIDLNNKQITLYKVVGGVDSFIMSTAPLDIEIDSFYIWTIQTDFNDIDNSSLLRAYQDNNKVIEATDSEYTKGNFAITSKTGLGEISEIEMFQAPLEIDHVNPGFNL